MENVMQFIRPELFVLIVFLYCVGLFLKKWEGFHKDWMIPYILLAVSFAITFVYVGFYLGEGFGADIVVAVIIQSVLIASVAVFGNELIKQITVRRKEE